ncbi:hypothetical protein ACQPZX_29630 [Actinoplanes sp. CA-142083]|uniref:hypothetical protein n=1 Tax=Actinoplanes sp. CA-142083 TaxID=3239903 RepID=UPI003D8A25FA
MSMRRVAPAIALFFLSPLVAEFLLGDFTLAQLPFLVALAPAYGGAAVLVREVTRRAGRGWVTMILLALAYGVLEEGLETQSLFNPDYLHAHLLDHGFVPALGISIPWTLFVLTLHTVWSISVPIALVEEWTDRRTEPWLRVPGLVVVAVLAVAGAVFTFGVSYADGHFMASPAQLITTVVVVAGLIAAAFLVPRDSEAGAGVQSDGAVAPAPWIVLVTALGAGAVLAVGDKLAPALGVPLLIVALAGTAVAIYRWSGRDGWDGRHRLAAAGGALLTYVWHSFLMHPVVESSTALVVVSHVVFALAALLLLAAEARRVRDRASVATQPVG